MCDTCGCDDAAGVRVIDLDRPHEHEHLHDDDRPHDHLEPPANIRMIPLEQRILAKNDDLADRNRRWFAGRGIVALNLMSSPGSGKTTLLERTISDLGPSMPISVIEGDQETVFDAQRIRATGCRVVQINTGAGCHLDATMLADGLDSLQPPPGSLVFIENVGNLVCPALFDLGEANRVVIMSVTEGADKPLKYPHMFRTADLVLINKIDLLPYVDFDIARCRQAARQVNPKLTFLDVCATKGDGMDGWYDWLRATRSTS